MNQTLRRLAVLAVLSLMVLLPSSALANEGLNLHMPSFGSFDNLLKDVGTTVGGTWGIINPSTPPAVKVGAAAGALGAIRDFAQNYVAPVIDLANQGYSAAQRIWTSSLGGRLGAALASGR